MKSGGDQDELDQRGYIQSPFFLPLTRVAAWGRRRYIVPCDVTNFFPASECARRGRSGQDCMAEAAESRSGDSRPRVAILDKQGKAVYDAAGEVDESRLAEALDRTLRDAGAFSCCSRRRRVAWEQEPADGLSSRVAATDLPPNSVRIRRGLGKTRGEGKRSPR